MTDSRILDLHARELEQQTLSVDELRELKNARQGNHQLANLLHDDLELHAGLKEFHRIEATAAHFAQRCARAVLDAGHSDAAHLPIRNATGIGNLVRRPIAGQASGIEPADDFLLDLTKSPRAQRQSSRWLVMTVWGSAIGIIGIVVASWMLRPSDNQKGHLISMKPTIDHRAMREKTDEFANQVKRLVPRDEDDTDPVEYSILPAPKNDGRKKQVAELRGAANPVWGSKPKQGFAYPAAYELRSGLAEVVLRDGTELAFQGPASVIIRSPNEIELESGKFRVRPIRGAGNKVITTPTVRLSGRDELLAFVDVKPNEETLVQIEQGQLNAQPWNVSQAEEMTLSESGMNRGVFGPPWRKGASQLSSAIILNDEGAFCGLLAANHRSMKVASPELFAQILAASGTLIKEDAEDFALQWSSMIEKLERGVAESNVKLNGQSLRASNAGEIFERFTQVREQMAVARRKLAPGVSEFSGSISVNGRDQRFGSPEEFRKAQTQMFGNLFSRIIMEPQPYPNAAFQFQVTRDLPGQNNGIESNGDDDRLASPSNQSFDSQGRENNPNVQQATGRIYFSGSININGQVIQFDSLDVFNRATRELQSRRR